MSVDNITKDYTYEDPAMPRAYGYYVPKLYEAGEIAKELQVSMSSVLMSQDLESKEGVTRDVARQKMFDSMDLKATGVITFDEWLKFCQEHIAAKTATMDPHPIIDHGSVDQYKTFIKTAIATPSCPEHVELYWYMLEIFTDHDTDKDGIIRMTEFTAMMNEFLTVPKKHSLAVPSEVRMNTSLFTFIF